MKESTKEFIQLVFLKTATPQQRKKWLEKFPRPACKSANPPSIDKPMYTLIQSSMTQTKKKIMSHDRFLAKGYASDAAGPLSFLLSELQAGKAIPPEKAIQAALLGVGNTFAHLSVERRRSILQHLNKQLVLYVPMAEEDFPNEGKLFGPSFDKRAKDRVDAIKSLSHSSSIFFRLGDSHGKKSFKGQGSRGKGPAQDRFAYYKKPTRKSSTPTYPY